MKKFIRIVALVLVALFIVGCSQKEAKKKTEVYSYQQDVAGVELEITECFTYKGDEFLAIGVKKSSTYR
ncbi:TPA: lipoprotein [Streptococcus suis]